MTMLVSRSAVTRARAPLVCCAQITNPYEVAPVVAAPATSRLVAPAKVEDGQVRAMEQEQPARVGQQWSSGQLVSISGLTLAHLLAGSPLCPASTGPPGAC